MAAAVVVEDGKDLESPKKWLTEDVFQDNRSWETSFQALRTHTIKENQPIWTYRNFNLAD